MIEENNQNNIVSIYIYPIIQDISDIYTGSNAFGTEDQVEIKGKNHSDDGNKMTKGMYISVL